MRGNLLEVVRGETFLWSRREMTRVGGGHQNAARGMGFERQLGDKNSTELVGELDGGGWGKLRCPR